MVVQQIFLYFLRRDVRAVHIVRAMIFPVVMYRSEKAMAPHSSSLAWKIPWTEKPGRLQLMRSLRVGHDWATSLSLFTFMLWRRKWQPTPLFLPGESKDGGAWWAAVYGVTQSQIRLKQLSSSSSMYGCESWTIKKTEDWRIDAFEL